MTYFSLWGITFFLLAHQLSWSSEVGGATRPQPKLAPIVRSGKVLPGSPSIRPVVSRVPQPSWQKPPLPITKAQQEMHQSGSDSDLHVPSRSIYKPEQPQLQNAAASPSTMLTGLLLLNARKGETDQYSNYSATPNPTRVAKSSPVAPTSLTPPPRIDTLQSRATEGERVGSTIPVSGCENRLPALLTITVSPPEVPASETTTASSSPSDSVASPTGNFLAAPSPSIVASSQSENRRNAKVHPAPVSNTSSSLTSQGNDSSGSTRASAQPEQAEDDCCACGTIIAFLFCKIYSADN